ncbi:MAG: 50S ribosomal protein L10, partial [Pseudomonadota bacterium]
MVGRSPRWRRLMDRAGKQAARQELEKIFEASGAVIVTHYSGLNVAELTELRTKLRDG